MTVELEAMTTTAPLRFDHAYCSAHDIDEARADLKRLGFTLTSRDPIPDYNMVTSSVVFRDGTWMAWVGLLFARSLADVDRVAEERSLTATDTETLRALIESYKREGAKPLLIVRPINLDEFTNHIKKAGVAMSSIMRMGRATQTSAGEDRLEFEMTRSQESVLGGLALCGLNHVRPEVFFRAELMTHANGATGIATLRVDTSVDLEVMERPARVLLGVHDVRRNADELSMTLGTTQLIFRHRSRNGGAMTGEADIVGIGIRTPDLTATASWLREQCIEFHRSDDGIVVRGSITHGTTFEFTQGHIEQPMLVNESGRSTPVRMG